LCQIFRICFYKLDEIVKLLQRSFMDETAALNSEAREFIDDLSKSLKEKSAKISPVDLAQYAGMAFEIAFTGSRKEDKLTQALARGLSVREKMAGEEGGSLSADETARLLGMTKQSVLNLYHAGKVLAWRTEKQGSIRFPAWQFNENRRLPGLEEVLARLNAGHVLDDWGKIGFFLQTHGLLDNRRPLDLLRENRLGLVLKAAVAYVE
jgi:hypothetical protein